MAEPIANEPEIEMNWGLLRLPRTILFGPGRRHGVGGAAREYGTRVLICTDRRLAESPELGGIRRSLERSGCVVDLFADTEPELPMHHVMESAKLLRRSSYDVIVAVGGGSCIDMAKVAALLIAHGGHLDAYIGERKVPGPVLPIVAVPTTAGTGSEATPVAVVYDDRTGTKRGVSSPYLIPVVAICDSDLIQGCPPGLIAAAGADALAHLIESLTAIRHDAGVNLPYERVFVGQNALTDQVATDGLQRLVRSLPPFYRGVDDASVRDDVMFGALSGGISLGTAGTAAAHALQYPIGSLTGTSHGAGVGALLPYVMRFNLPVREQDFALIGYALGAEPTGDVRADAIVAIQSIDRVLAEIETAPDLAQLGVRETDLEEIASRGLDAARLVANNPRTLDHEAALTIVRRAHAGDRTFD